MNFPFVKVYENILPPEFCKNVINEFDTSPDERIKRNIDDYIKFEELNVNHFLIDIFL